MAIVYDDYEKKERETDPLLSVSTRPNGSLYSRQKRSIADACEWMRLHQTKEQRAIVFVLTSPGYTSVANTPKFISRFVENMRANYGMGEYVWVREMTKKGYPHFHFVALWHHSQWFLKKPTVVNSSGVTIPDPNQSEPMITLISRYWSKQFKSDSLNSVRLGTYKGKKRVGFYLTTARHAWYLTKYLGKDIESGFPIAKPSTLAAYGMALIGKPVTQDVTTLMYMAGLVKRKRDSRSFAVSYNLNLFSSPTLFEACHLEIDRLIAPTVSGQSVEVKRTQRIWVSDDGQLIDNDLQGYHWRWTGHGETYIGLEQRRTESRKQTLVRGQ